MKKVIIMIVSFFFLKNSNAQNVGIGTNTPNINAALEIKSNSKGLLIPRLSRLSKLLMPGVVKGMMVYDTTNSAFYYHNGNSWRLISETNQNGLLTDLIENPQITVSMTPLQNAIHQSGLLYDPGGPGFSYPNNFLGYYHLTYNPNIIRYKIVIEEMDLGGPLDTLEIYSEYNNADKLVITGNVTGTWYFAPYGGDLIFRFKTNATVNAAGFKISWSKLETDELNNEPAPFYGWYFNQSKTAARGGLHSDNNAWDTERLGLASFAFGANVTAEGNYSFAAGASAVSNGHGSVSMGGGTRATGTYSNCFGSNNIAKGFAGTVVGMNNDSILLNNEVIQSSLTPMFVVGNGANSASRSNAMIVRYDGNTGINNSNPNTNLDVKGDFALRQNDIIIANFGNNNVNPGKFSFINITGPTAGFSITGLQGGTDGKIITLLNLTGQNMTIENLNTSSDPVNRINTLTGANIITTGNASVTLQYSIAHNRWMVIAVRD